MKNYVSGGALRLLFPVLLATAGLLSTACKKDDTTTTTQDYTAIDDAIIQKYLVDSTIVGAIKQPSGMYFVPKVTNPTATLATANKTVYVLYTGKLMNGVVFDKQLTNPFRFVLGVGQVISGWDTGIALMHEGDKAQLIIPSAMAYGSSGAGTLIPANAVLRFDVQVVAVR